MCGLVAYYKLSDRPLDAQVIEDMTHALTHRGPNDYGLCFSGNDGPALWRHAHNTPPLREPGVAMGHRRLSVFDLTEVGRQPFVSADKRYAIVFNGEIYNYLELREELKKLGHRFSTDCDTEVLLAAYQEWGPACFSRLNGVWGIVVWDHRERVLVVARDRLGEKPLFYTRLGDDWVFASEVKAFMKHPDITPLPSEQALLQFIANGWAPSGADSYFDNIKAVEPGTYLTISKGGVTKSTFWTLGERDSPHRKDEATAVEELDELLTDAVRLRLRGDLRVGSMLSGGVDSTSVISSIGKVLASRPSDGRMIGDRLQAFTASFPGLPIDETEKVEELCRSIEISAHKVHPSQQSGIEQRLNDVAFSMEGPFWTPAIIVNDSLMKLVRSSDAQIVLDGMGGDELFAGFARHLPLALRDSLHALRIGETIDILTGMNQKHGKSILKELARALVPQGFEEYLRNSYYALRGQNQHWETDLFRHAFQPRTSDTPNLKGMNELDSSLRRDLLQNNVPRWLEMGDRISMANSVVCRSPFFDYRLVDFAFSLDNSLKIHKGETKYILREAKRKQLPSTIVNDFRKFPFSGPGAVWLQGPLKKFALSLKDDGKTRLSGFLNGNALNGIIDDYYENGKTGGSATWRLWRLLSAEAWLRAYS